MRRKTVYVMAVSIVAVLAVAKLEVSPSQGAEPAAIGASNMSDAALPEVPKTIAGKAYNVTPGKLPGTFDVTWGDQSMTWKPQPWMEPRYASMGPRYYTQWIKAGLPRPFEVPVAERDKLPGNDLMERCMAESFFPPYVNNGWDEWVSKVYLPNGGLRTESHGFELYSSFELGLGKEYLTANQTGKVRRLYLWQQIGPEELRGEGGFTTILTDPTLEPEDTLYLPSVRKMRRLAGAVAKQYFPGTVGRYEDDEYNFALPELNYKLIGAKLFNPPESYRGYGAKDFPEAKRVGNAGDVNLIIEITPKPGVSWWYAKRLFYCGAQTMAFNYSEEYDPNGKMIRRTVRQVMTGSKFHLATENGPPAPDWWTLWGVETIEEFTSGFTNDTYIEIGGYNAKVPTSVFSAENLLRQSMTLSEWIAP